MAHVIAFANHKGGCGKTTAVANIGAALRALGERVLLIDGDPQGNLSELFGAGDPEAPGPRLEDALDNDVAPAPWTDRPMADGSRDGLAGGVHLIPCTDDLATVVRDHATDEDFEFRLRELIERHGPSYDFVLIDTPPGLGELSTMALLAARWVVVPTRPADFDVGGAVKIADLIDGAIAEYNPQVRVLGVLIGQTARRWNLGRDARVALREAGIPELAERIPFMVRVGAAPRYAAPTIVLEPDSRVGCAYRRVAAAIADAVARPDLRAVSA